MGGMQTIPRHLEIARIGDRRHLDRGFGAVEE
jgi:hypothetical protein